MIQVEVVVAVRAQFKGPVMVMMSLPPPGVKFALAGLMVKTHWPNAGRASRKGRMPKEIRMGADYLLISVGCRRRARNVTNRSSSAAWRECFLGGKYELLP